MWIFIQNASTEGVPGEAQPNKKPDFIRLLTSNYQHLNISQALSSLPMPDR